MKLDRPWRATALLPIALGLAVAGCSSDAGAAKNDTHSASAALATASTSDTSAASATASTSDTSAAVAQPSASATLSTGATAPATVSRTATTTASPSASAGAQSGPRACGNGDVRVSTSPRPGQGGAGGHGGFVLILRNASHVTCTLHGYPGLDSLRNNGTVLAHARRTLNGYLGGSEGGVPTVSLRPGRSASAKVEFLNIGLNDAKCVQATMVATTVPNTTRIITLTARTTTCALQVHPVVPGSTGNYQLH